MISTDYVPNRLLIRLSRYTADLHRVKFVRLCVFSGIHNDFVVLRRDKSRFFDSLTPVGFRRRLNFCVPINHWRRRLFGRFAEIV